MWTMDCLVLCQRSEYSAYLLLLTAGAVLLSRKDADLSIEF